GSPIRLDRIEACDSCLAPRCNRICQNCPTTFGTNANRAHDRLIVVRAFNTKAITNAKSIPSFFRCLYTVFFCLQPDAATSTSNSWNLTPFILSEFNLAPAGTTNWGSNQCKNDRDGTVSPK